MAHAVLAEEEVERVRVPDLTVRRTAEANALPAPVAAGIAALAVARQPAAVAR